MNQRLAKLFGISLLAAPMLLGCVGETPGAGDGPDAGGGGGEVDAGGGGGADGGGNPAALAVTGRVLDYFLPSSPLANAILSTDGLTPALDASSAADGAFALNDVPPGSTFYLNGTAQANYKPTRGLPVIVTDASVTADFFMVSNADTQRQYASVGMAMLPNTSILIIDLKRNNGLPLTGVPAADVTLTDALAAPIGDGPYFFGPGGDIQTIDLAPASADYGGRARAAFINVPAGSYTLKVNYLSGGGGGGGDIMTFVVPVVSVGDAAILTQTGGQGGGGALPGNLTFTTDIYPILQKAALGGDACANCHTLGGLANFLQFDLGAALVHQNLLARPGVIDLITPIDSMLLTKPMYEVPPNHPNATWLDAQNPSYLKVLTWIQQGALL